MRFDASWRAPARLQLSTTGVLCMNGHTPTYHVVRERGGWFVRLVAPPAVALKHIAGPLLKADAVRLAEQRAADHEPKALVVVHNRRGGRL
jgi:hypothetical protein